MLILTTRRFYAYIYRTCGLRQDNLGLSNAHTLVSTIFGSGHVDVISTLTHRSEPTLSFETRFIVTWHFYS